MFYRKGFVTNSSSTSFIGFGIELDDSAVICKYALDKDPGLFTNTVDGILRYHDMVDQEDEALYRDHILEWLEHHDYEDEFSESYLEQKGLSFEYTPWGDRYVMIGYPEVRLDQQGFVSVETECLKEGFDLLTNIINTMKLDKEIQLHSECYQDG